jgi:hypothetical protein
LILKDKGSWIIYLKLNLNDLVTKLATPLESWNFRVRQVHR